MATLSMAAFHSVPMPAAAVWVIMGAGHYPSVFSAQIGPGHRRYGQHRPVLLEGILAAPVPDRKPLERQGLREKRQPCI